MLTYFWNPSEKAFHAERAENPKNHEKAFEWYNLETGETMLDGPTVATIVMSKVLLDVKMDVFNQLKQMKEIIP